MKRLGPILLLVVVAAAALWALGSPRSTEAPAPEARPTVTPVPIPAAPGPATPAPVAVPSPTADAGPRAAAIPNEVGPVVLRLPVNAEPQRRQAAATLLRAHGGKAFKQKKFQVALPAFELAVRLDPDSPEGAERLGSTYARTGDATRAIYHYNRFLELAPNDPLALELREDVESWLKDNPNPALQMMRDGALRPLSQSEADLHAELARRLVDTSNPDADLAWFADELLRRADGG